MKDIFVDLLLEGHSPEDLATAMTEALHEVETVKAQIARSEALVNCVDAMNAYFGLVDPDWEDLGVDDVEAIADMICVARSTTKAILDAIEGFPAVEVRIGEPEHKCCCNHHEPDPAPAPASKEEEEDNLFDAIFDFLNELGL